MRILATGQVAHEPMMTTDALGGTLCLYHPS